MSPPITDHRRFGRKETFFSFVVFFLNEQVSGTLRHACKNVRPHIRRSDCVGPMSRHSLIISWSRLKSK